MLDALKQLRKKIAAKQNVPAYIVFSDATQHLFTMPGGKRKKFNVYAETREQCEIKLAEMIERVKTEIAEEKAKLKEGDS